MQHCVNGKENDQDLTINTTTENYCNFFLYFRRKKKTKSHQSSEKKLSLKNYVPSFQFGFFFCVKLNLNYWVYFGEEKFGRPHNSNNNSKTMGRVSRIKEENTTRLGRGCYKPGIATRNPFLNYLREVRRLNCGISILQIARQGGAEWRRMTEEQKCPYIALAFRTRPRQSRRRLSRKLIKKLKRRVKIKS